MNKAEIADIFYTEQQRCAQLLHDLGRTERARFVEGAWLKFNGRLRRVLGRATVARSSPNFGRIEIGQTHQRSDARKCDVVDTIRHELAHIAAYTDLKHGPEWQHMATLFGAAPKAATNGIKYKRNRRRQHEAVCENGHPLWMGAKQAGWLERGRYGYKHNTCGARVVRLTGKTRSK